MDGDVLEIVCERADGDGQCGHKTVGETTRQAEVNHALHVIQDHPISDEKEAEIRDHLTEKWGYEPGEW